MSSDWTQYQLCEIGRIVTGKTPSTAQEEFFDGSVPFLTPTDMIDGQKSVTAARTLTDAGLATVKNCLVPRGVSVSCIGWQMGKSVLVLKPTVTNQQINTIVVDESRFNISFVYYLLSSMRNKIFELGATATRTPIVNKSTFGQIKILAPAMSEQENISVFCSSLDDRITLLRETNATLEAIAQALFKSWFVDFDPVRAKAEGREPEGMDAPTAALFPDSFEESELGLVPKGWLVKPLGDFSEILNGFAFKSEDYVEESDGVFLLRTTNFESGGFAARLDKDVFLPKIFLETFSRFICAPFDFHLVMVGASVGKTSLLLPHMLPALRNQNMWCFRAKGGFESVFFIHEAVKIKVSEALRSTSGSAREFLRKGDFALSSVVLPTPDLLSKFETTISALKIKVAINEHQALTLSNIRDTLLPRLISGQLRLPEAEQTVEEALA